MSRFEFVERQRTDDSVTTLRLTFPTLPGVEEELQSLVALERRCCSFADWSIRSDDSRVVLDVSADGEEAIAAVHGMFGRLRSEPGTAPMPR